MTRWATSMLPAVLLIPVLATCRPAAAGLLLADEDFRHFEGTGLVPGEGPALDSRLWAVHGFSDGDSAFGDTRPGGDFARGSSSGGERTGGLYAFRLPGGGRGLGVQSTGGDFSPGSLLRRVTNTADVALGGLLVLFDLWVLNDGDRSTRVLLDAHPNPSLARGVRDDTATRVTPAAADALGWQPVSVQASFPDLAVPARGEVILRWLFDDAGGTGSRDELALSRVRVEGLPVATPPPEPPPVPVAAPPVRWLSAVLLALALVHRARRQPLPIGNAGATFPVAARS